MAALNVIMEKVLVQRESPFLYLSIRLLLAGSVLTAFNWFRGSFEKLDRWHWMQFIQVVIFQLYGSYLLNALVLPNIPAAYVCLAYNLSPFITAGMSYFFFNERITKSKGIGLICGFAGFTFMLDFSAIDHFTGTWVDFAGLMIAVLGNCYGFIVMKKIIRRKSCNVMSLIGPAMMGAGALCAITTFLIKNSYPVQINNMSFFLSYVIAITLFGTIVAYGLYVYLLNFYSATFISFCTFLYVIFGAFFGWALLGETISWNFIISILCIAVGLYIFYREEQGATQA